MSIYAAISAYIVVSTSLSKKALVELSIGVKCFYRKIGNSRKEKQSLA